jgi:hypothetical protein
MPAPADRDRPYDRMVCPDTGPVAKRPASLHRKDTGLLAVAGPHGGHIAMGSSIVEDLPHRADHGDAFGPAPPAQKAFQSSSERTRAGIAAAGSGLTGEA